MDSLGTRAGCTLPSKPSGQGRDLPKSLMVYPNSSAISISIGSILRIPSMYYCLKSKRPLKATLIRIASLWAVSIPSISKVGSASA